MSLNCCYQWDYFSCPGDRYKTVDPWRNNVDRGKPKNLGERNCPSATLSTTNPTWTDLGANPDLPCERLAANHLSPDTTKMAGNYEVQRCSDFWWHYVL
jgi:hypothetical protein